MQAGIMLKLTFSHNKGWKQMVKTYYSSNKQTFTLLVNFTITSHLQGEIKLSYYSKSKTITNGKVIADEEEQQNQTRIKPPAFIKISLKQYSKK